MAVSLGSRGLAGFDRPLELLKDCHRRIEHFLGVLLRVANEEGAFDERKRVALETALRYFREAAPRHTEDEERSLFPRLQQSGAREAQSVLATIRSLEADHAVAEKLHERVEALGRQWLSAERLAAESLAEFREALGRLQELYEAHIRVEDEQVFPAAGRALKAEELAGVGREMKSRRTKSGWT